MNHARQWTADLVLDGPPPDPQGVTLDGSTLRFVTRDLEIARIADGELVPGARTGSFVFDFSSSSSVLDPSSGQFAIPEFSHAYRFLAISNPDFEVPGSEPIWRCERFGALSIVVKRFSREDGQGVATVELPVRDSMGGRSRGPSLPIGEFLAEVALSVDGPVHLDDEGDPVGVEHLLAFEAEADYPAVWMDVPGGGIPIAGGSTALVLSRETSPEDRAVTIHAARPDLVELRTPEGDPLIGPVVIEAGDRGAAIRVAGVEAGIPGFELFDTDGTHFSSAPDLVVTTALPGDAPLSSAGHPAGRTVAAALGSFVSPGTTPLETGLARRCKKATVIDHGTYHNKCGECALTPDIPDACDPDTGVIFYTEAACVGAILSQCYTVSDLQQPAATYQVEVEYSETTNGCAWVRVDLNGNILGIVSSTAEGAVQLSKFCCILKKSPESDWATIDLDQCGTTEITVF